jgi:signal transduction histidine kinase
MNGRPTVLIVDDEVGVRESLRAILMADYDVLTADTGAAAIELLRQHDVDVVTLDLRMPGMGGIGVLEQAKAINPDVEAIIITGYGSLDTAVQGLRFRAFDYISKPFDVDHVRRLVEAAVARRSAVRIVKSVPEQILSTLSHEFRTPLNVIMGYSSMVREQGEHTLSEDQRMALDRIQSNSSSLLAYVETIFYMAELDRGRMPEVTVPVRVADVLGAIAGTLAPRAAEKGIVWRLDTPADLEILTDGDMLQRLVQALADNAVRWTNRGDVLIRARAVTGGLSVEVCDSGPGLDPDLILETEDVMAGRAGVRPPRLLGFGLRLTGRLVRTLGASLTIASSPSGTACQLVVPALTSRIRQIATA